MLQVVRRPPLIAVIRFDPGPVHLRFMVSNVAPEQDVLGALRSPLPVPFHQYSMPIFTFSSGDAWEPSNKAMLFRIWGNTEQRSTVTLVFVGLHGVKCDP